VTEPRKTAGDHWYDAIRGPTLRQGDIFRQIAVYWLPEQLPGPGNESSAKLLFKTGDWIVLDASCDLEQKKCSNVLLAPVYEATRENLKCGTDKEWRERLEVVRRGLYQTRFLLAEWPRAQPTLPYSFVDSTWHVLMPLTHLEAVEGQRIRLRSPLREQFGNWVGTCFSRVGPENETQIPSFTKSLHDAHRLRATPDD
jgi:hypothetical protein